MVAPKVHTKNMNMLIMKKNVNFVVLLLMEMDVLIVPQKNIDMAMAQINVFGVVLHQREMDVLTVLLEFMKSNVT